MLEPQSMEIRRELTAARVAAMHRSARPSPAGPLRRALGNAFVRLGLLLGSDGIVPPLVAQPESLQETPAPAGVSSFLWPFPSEPDPVTPLYGEADLAWESAAPYGIRVGDRVNRMQSRSGFRPGAPSARSRGSRRPARFDAR